MSDSNNFYWKTVATSSTGALIQQRYKLIGGDTLIPTEKHRRVDRGGSVVGVVETP